MNLTQSIQIVSKLHNAYTSDRYAKPEELQARIDLYCIYFADIPFRIVNKEADIWIKSHREMPTINELLARCKDALAIERSPNQDASQIKPTWELILEARGVDTDAPPTPEVEQMVDQLIRALRNDPKARARYEASKNNKPVDGSLPYEI